MEDKFHELALEKLAGRASAEESRKLGEYLGQDPALQAEYERLKLEVQAAKDLIPLIKETDSDSEDLPEYEKNMLMAEVRSVFSPDNQESEPAHEADPQQEEPFWKYWKWAGGLTATALLAFIILTPNPEITEDEPKYTKKSTDDSIQAADTLKSQYEDLRQDPPFDSSLEGFKTGEGNGLLTAIASIEMHDQLVDFEIEEYVSLAKSNTDSDFRAWLEKQKKRRGELGKSKKERERELTEVIKSYIKNNVTNARGKRWRENLADCEKKADRLKSQYEDLRQLLARSR